MIYQLISLEKCRDNSPELILDDFSSGSEAVYVLENPGCLEVVYCCPDELRGEEPRCDYLLYIHKRNLVKFVELKGADSSGSGHSCCSTSWEHGFHQLEATYWAYRSLLDEKDVKDFVLSTVLPRERINARYKRYARYMRLREMAQGNVSILGRDESDELPVVQG